MTQATTFQCFLTIIDLSNMKITLNLATSTAADSINWYITKKEIKKETTIPLNIGDQVCFYTLMTDKSSASLASHVEFNLFTNTYESSPTTAANPFNAGGSRNAFVLGETLKRTPTFTYSDSSTISGESESGFHLSKFADSEDHQVFHTITHGGCFKKTLKLFYQYRQGGPIEKFIGDPIWVVGTGNGLIQCPLST